MRLATFKPEEWRSHNFVGYLYRDAASNKRRERATPIRSGRSKLMYNSKLGIGLIAALICLIGCAGTIRYPNYYVLNVPASVPAKVAPKTILGSAAVREFTA